MKTKRTREQWLLKLTHHMDRASWFKTHPLPAIRISCGWPSSRGLSTRKRSVGQCWSPESSADKTTEIFISPYLSDPIEVAHTLLHELIHAAVGLQYGHRGPFAKLARKLGLVGKMTATTAGPELTARLERIIAKLGAYPHSPLDGSKRPKQSTRLIKASCGGCGYTIRLSRKWMDAVGLPICPACDETFTSDNE